MDNISSTGVTCGISAGVATYLGSSGIRNYSLLGNRYIHEGNCWANTGILYSGIKIADNSATTTYTCNDIQG